VEAHVLAKSRNRLFAARSPESVSVTSPRPEAAKRRAILSLFASPAVAATALTPQEA